MAPTQAEIQHKVSPLMEPIGTQKFWRAVTGEFLAMAAFVYVCVGCALTNLGIVEGSMSSLGTRKVDGAEVKVSYGAALSIAACFGFTIFVLIHCFGHISGANINPAVTAGLMVTRQISFVRGVFYMLAQYLGSIVASAMLMQTMALNGDTMGGFNALSGPDDNRVWRGFWTELCLTGMLVYTVMATIDPSRPSGTTTLGPMAIGMAVFIAHLFLVPITGCGINPARSLGPALFSTKAEAHTDLWVFMVAPYAGGILGALLYVLWFAEQNFARNLFAHADEVEDAKLAQSPAAQEQV